MTTHFMGLAAHYQKQAAELSLEERALRALTSSDGPLSCGDAHDLAVEACKALQLKCAELYFLARGAYAEALEGEVAR